MAAPSLLRGGLRRLFTGLFGNGWASPPARGLREGESGGGPGRGAGPRAAPCPVASPRSGETVAFTVLHSFPPKNTDSFRLKESHFVLPSLFFFFSLQSWR